MSKKRELSKEQQDIIRERQAAEDARRQAAEDRIMKAKDSLVGSAEERIERKQLEMDYYNEAAQILEKVIEALTESYKSAYAAYKPGNEAYLDSIKRIQEAGFPANFQAPNELNVLGGTLNSHNDLVKAYRVNADNHKAAASRLEHEIESIRDRENARLNPPEPIIPPEELELIELRQRIEKLETKKTSRFFGGSK